MSISLADMEYWEIVVYCWVFCGLSFLIGIFLIIELCVSNYLKEKYLEKFIGSFVKEGNKKSCFVRFSLITLNFIEIILCYVIIGKISLILMKLWITNNELSNTLILIIGVVYYNIGSIQLLGIINNFNNLFDTFLKIGDIILLDGQQIEIIEIKIKYYIGKNVDTQNNILLNISNLRSTKIELIQKDDSINYKSNSSFTNGENSDY